MSQSTNNWKLKLRYGKITTPYQHFSVLADGVAGELTDGFECPAGKAVISMKVWASSTDEAIDMVQSIGRQIGFTVTGKIEVYTTEPGDPPEVNPFGYDIHFTPYG